ncbi:hypothetical protein N9U53_01030 [Euryarchaeota archaeon]|nr:hypothetical protein [Euryarchaeota archaeon]
MVDIDKIYPDSREFNYLIAPLLLMPEWISALIASLFGAGDEVERILEDE